MKIASAKITEYVLGMQKSMETVHPGFNSDKPAEIYGAVKYYADEIYDPMDDTFLYGEGAFRGGILDLGMIAVYYGEKSDKYTRKAMKVLSDILCMTTADFESDVKMRMMAIANGIDVRALDHEED